MTGKQRWLARWTGVEVILLLLLGAFPAGAAVCWPQVPGAATPPTVLFLRGDFERARQAFADEADRQPDKPTPRIGLIRSLLRLDHWEDALKAADIALAKFPENGDLRGLRALALLRAGRIDSAIAEAKAARQSEPFSFYANLALGQTAVWDANPPLARSAARRAIEIRPDDPDAWLARVDAASAGTYGSAGDPEYKDEDALYAARKYLSLSPRGYPHSVRLSAIRALVGSWASRRNAFKDIPLFEAVAPVTESELRRRERTGENFEVHVPFEFRYGFMVLTVTLDGVPFRLIFDTGGARSVLLVGAAARRLRGERVGSGVLRGASGEEASARFKVRRLKVGDLVLGPIPVDTVGPKPGLGDGVIGGAAFDNWAVTADFTARELILRRGRDARAPDPAPGCYIVAQTFRYHSGKIFLPLRVPGPAPASTPGDPAAPKPDDTPLWGLMDTGSSLDMLSLRVADRLAAAADIPSRQVLRGKRALTAGIGESAPDVAYTMFPRRLTLLFGHDGDNGAFYQPMTIGLSILDEQVSPVLGAEMGCLLGMPTLRLYERVTFDYPRRRVTFEAKTPPADSRNSKKPARVANRPTS